MKTYTFYQDPGHGWLKVPKSELEPIKDKISPFSYMRGDWAYLEEDLDAYEFIKHRFSSYEEARQHIKELHTNKSSKIRSYDSYST